MVFYTFQKIFSFLNALHRMNEKILSESLWNVTFGLLKMIL